jgi:PAS domain S-box-containing protein
METGRSRLSWNIAKLDSPVRTVILVSLVAIIGYEATRLAYALRIRPDYIASFWPVTPFLVAVLLLAPRRIWPAIIAAGLGAMALGDLENGVPIGSIIWFSLGDLAAVLGATLGISRLFKGAPHLNSVKSLAQYLAVAVFLVPLASALLGATGSVPGRYWLQWRLWFFSDALAFLTVTPAILNWVREGRTWARRSHNYLEFAALMTSLVLFGYLAFMGTARREPPALLYSLVPLLLWAALRLGLKGVSTSMVVVAFLSIWGAAHGRGPFAEQGPLNNVFSLQLFLFFAAIPFMFLAVLVEGQRRAQQALIDEEAQLAEAQRLAEVGSWWWDPKTDTVTWSKELYRIAGIDPSMPAVSYKDHPKLYTAESWERLRAAVEEALRTGTPYELDLEMIRSDGARRWLVARGEAHRDASGDVVQLRGTVHDITERKRVEQALRESEERLHLAVRAGRMYAFEWDMLTDVIVRIGECADIFNWMDDPMCITARQLVERIHPEDREAFAVLRGRLTPEQPNYKISYRVLRPDGSVIWLEANGRVFFDDQGRMLRIIGMVADITERKFAEEVSSSVSRRLIEAHEEERTWIARELHDDINQQIALLTVQLKQWTKHPPNSEANIRKHIGSVCEQLSDLAKDIQALSHRLHSSKLEYLGIGVAAGSFCKELSEQQQVEIEFSQAGIPHSLPKEIALCLFRVLQEALQNAVKHSGERHFKAELHGTSSEIQLTVNDQGVGFNEQDAMGGRGLGLISMRERMQLVGGAFSIESKPGGGTTIRARVPIIAEQHRACAAG